MTSPAGALAHLPCCHTNGGTIRVGLRDGGGGFFFFSTLVSPTPWEARGKGRWKVGPRGKGKAEGARVALTR